MPRESGSLGAVVDRQRRRHRRRHRCRHLARASAAAMAPGGYVELRLGRNVLGSLLERPFEPGARLAAERLRHLHGRIEIGRLGGIARGSDGGRLAAGFLAIGRAWPSAASEAAMRAAADPGFMRGAPLPGSSGVSGGRLGSIGWRWGPRGICRAGGRAWDRCAAGRSARAAAARMLEAAACGAASGHRRRRRAAAIPRSNRAAIARQAGAALPRGASGAGRGGAAGAGAGSAGGARRPRGPPLRISSR